MKILLGNNTLSFLGGSETHTFTFAKRLKELGHEVSCYSPLLGVFSKKLEKLGIKCFSDLLRDNKGLPEIVFANHHQVVRKIKDLWPNVPIVNTIHGIIHFFPGTQTKAPEHPGEADAYVAVSEEIQKKLKDDYGLESTVIRNFFEIKDEPISASPKQILFNSNYETPSGEIYQTVVKVAEHYNAKLVSIGHNFEQSTDVEKLIRQSDVVIGMGRSVLEGCAMGRLGVVHGRWGTGGVVCLENLKGLQYFNFSGRNANKRFYSDKEMVAEIDKHYNPLAIDQMMSYMKNQHDVNNAVDKYIKLAENLIGGYENKEQNKQS